MTEQSRTGRLNAATAGRGAAVLASMFFTAAALAAAFVPYPGKREATLVDVEAPARVVLSFNTDSTGFTRVLHVRPPGLVVARDTPQADECERRAAQKALQVTREFLTGARKLYVEDVRMENSADEDAVAEVLSDRGSLSQALIDAGVARRDGGRSVDWCRK
ncbi:MAG TPA: hypothetical protein ENK12_12060 [Gammaproteobacteria bacterium]|nr:hypothetical protein [Gammaproteobacteria bacterium]